MSLACTALFFLRCCRAPSPLPGHTALSALLHRPHPTRTPLRRRRPGAAKGGKGSQAYMRVSEEEIADDYPAPQVRRSFFSWCRPRLGSLYARLRRCCSS